MNNEPTATTPDDNDTLSTFIRTAQYISRLNSSQDIYEEIIGIMSHFYKADWAAFVRIDDSTNELDWHHHSAPEQIKQTNAQQSLQEAVKRVLESGFFDISEEKEHTTILLPIHEEGQVRQTMLVGYPSGAAPTKSRLNLLLAVAGLTESALERRHAEQELQLHQQHLESLVHERTDELRQKNIELVDQIAERVRTEAILRESEERFRTLNDSLSMGVVVIDNQRKIIHANQTIRTWFPHINFDDNSLHCFRTLHNPPLDQIGEGCPLGLTLQDGKNHRGERTTLIGGQERYLQMLSSPLRDESGQITAVIEVLEDITERKKAELELALKNERIRQAAENEARQLGKIEIVSGILHDVGNAIAGMGATLTDYRMAERWPEIDHLKRLKSLFDTESASFEHVLGSGKGDALCSYVGELLNQLDTRAEEHRHANDRMQSIITHISDILTLQRQYTRGVTTANESVFDVVMIMDDALHMLTSSTKKRGILIQRDYAPRREHISGDRTALMQVFINLLKNTCEAFDALGETDRAREISIRIAPQDDMLAIVLCDNGCGFDSEQEKHIFEHQFTTKQNGSGLGLPEVQSIVASHRGTIALTSDGPGLGATVTIMLPIHSDTKANQKQKEAVHAGT